ncbi:MAG: hypothetical protein Q7S45_00715 [Candidatus Curtissbacteria bacterium]|nr:hypothetical protein [Candidatus Curtissbacteria bacterium]
MKQKGTSLILTTVIVGTIVILALALLLFLKGGTTNTIQEAVTPPNQAEIQNSSDLDASASDLDITNIDSMDNDLNLIGQDASTF